MNDGVEEISHKRRKLSSSASSASSFNPDDMTQFQTAHFDSVSEQGEDSETTKEEDLSNNISAFAKSANSKMADQTITPFLAKHIPNQYAPLGHAIQTKNQTNSFPNSKYCYRHRPDLKCQRQADEPSMDQLQRELESLSTNDQQGITHVWSLFSAAPAKMRELMLKGILSQCCFSQLSFISANVRDMIRIDFISALPAEISFKILCYLDTTSLCKAAQVSRRWRTLADDDVVWHKMCEQHIDRKCTKCGWGLPLLERKRLRASKRQIQLRASGRGLNEWSPNITPTPGTPVECSETSQCTSSKRKLEYNDEIRTNIPVQPCQKPITVHTPQAQSWKAVYRDRYKVGTNWKYGRCSLKIFKGHTNGVMALQFDDTILATGSYDSTIKIWDIETTDEIRTLTGHASGIRCLQFDDNKLISGSLDASLRIWNWHTGECLNVLTGHDGGIIALHFADNLLASGSMDKTIRLWNFDKKSSFSLKGHSDWVNSVRIDSTSRTLFSASDDCTVRLWDLETKECIRIFEGHVGQVQQVIPLPPEFEWDHGPETDDTDDASSIANDEIGAPFPATPPFLETSPPPLPPTYGPSFLPTGTRPPPPRYILTSALDSTIRLWDTLTSKCLHRYFGHVEGVWALAADTLRIVSGAEDKTVKVWDPRSGKCERTFTGHRGPVTCIGLSDCRLVSGGEDGEVRCLGFRGGVRGRGWW
ncbi:MAG: hypothetical protein M1834_002771 [Cirrosporium novae-zelandiae]|nr:MAG: hypothetical protein M1834_002771 [Cirrosporium novae-zelandiae]